MNNIIIHGRHMMPLWIRHIIMLGVLLIPMRIHAETVWKPILNPNGVIFPSLILATAALDKKMDQDHPVAQLGAHMAAGRFLGDQRCLVGVRLKGPISHQSVEVTVKSEGLIMPSTEAFDVPGTNGDIDLYLTVPWNFAALESTYRTRSVTINYQVSMAGKPPDVKTLVGEVRMINDCPFNVNSHRIDWMFAAFVNEDHPLVQEIIKEAIDSKIVANIDGIQGGPEGAVRQMSAVWYALQRRKISYSNITAVGAITNGIFSQHVRFLDEISSSHQANCVDGSVLLASILRKIGIPSGLIIEPNHMYVAALLGNKLNDLRAIEGTMLGQLSGPQISAQASQQSFNEAMIVGSRKLHENMSNVESLQAIHRLRNLGIRPIFANRKGIDPEEERIRKEAAKSFDEKVAAYRQMDCLKRHDYARALSELAALRVDAQVARREEQLDAMIDEVRQLRLAENRTQMEGEYASALAQAKQAIQTEDQVEAVAALAHLGALAKDLGRTSEHEALVRHWDQKWQAKRRAALTVEIDGAVVAFKAALSAEDFAVAETQLVSVRGIAHELGRDQDIGGLVVLLARTREAAEHRRIKAELDRQLQEYEAARLPRQGRFGEAKDALRLLLAKAKPLGREEEMRIERMMDALPGLEVERKQAIERLTRSIKDVINRADYDHYPNARRQLQELADYGVASSETEAMSARLTRAATWFRSVGKDQFGDWGELDAGNGVGIRFRKIPVQDGKEDAPRELWVAEKELTNADVMALLPTWKEPKGAVLEQPAVGMTQELAEEISAVLGEKTKRKVRIPTEAEWLQACRGGTGRTLFFGDDKKADAFCWTLDNANGKTHPVGEKRANPFGLFDMLGNAAELCRGKDGLVICGGSYQSLPFDLGGSDDASEGNAAKTGLRLVMDP